MSADFSEEIETELFQRSYTMLVFVLCNVTLTFFTYATIMEILSLTNQLTWKKIIEVYQIDTTLISRYIERHSKTFQVEIFYAFTLH